MFSSAGVLSKPQLSSLLILPGLSPCMPQLIVLHWVLCSVSYRVRGFHRGMAALLRLTSPKVTQKGATWGSGRQSAPRRPHLQFKGKLTNQTLCHCQRKLMLENWVTSVKYWKLGLINTSSANKSKSTWVKVTWWPWSFCERNVIYIKTDFKVITVISNLWSD